MESSVSFGDWLRRRRKAVDLTQEALAEQIGCSVGLIRKIESDERRPSRQIAELLANILQIPTTERDKFIQVARAQLRTERLESIAEVADPLPEMPLAQTVDTPSRSTAPHPSAAQEPAAARYTLPIPPTPLIGRDNEVREINHLLANPECRLLTIVGSGGMGKTRVALALATNPSLNFRHGVTFVSLAALTSPEFIVSTLANALKFPFSGSNEPQQQLLNYLREKELLLILDNLEHLLEGVGLLTEILFSCPAIKILVTSRERLNLQGEWVFDLQGLPIPPIGLTIHPLSWEQPHSGDTIARYSSVALFVKSAQRVQANFMLSQENQADIAHICRLVEGMPLGIELAAAWVSLLSCKEIGQEIEQNIDFLAANRRDMPARHRSLRATFDYSWKYLTEAEQYLLRSLSIFRGGFGRDAAQQVADASLPLLSALLSKSLLRRQANGRYELHELVRQYAASQLSQDPQVEETIRDRHATWCLTLFCNAESSLQSKRQREMRDHLLMEIDNLRLAWAWAVKRGQFSLLGQAAVACWYLHELCGLCYEGDHFFCQAFVVSPASLKGDGQADADSQVALAHLRSCWGWFRYRVGHTEEARHLLSESLTLLRHSRPGSELLHALLVLGTIDFFRGAQSEAYESAEECLKVGRALNRLWYVALSSGAFGLLTQASGDYRAAENWWRQALDIWRVLGDPRYTSFALTNLSQATLALGRYEETKSILDESWQVARVLEDRMIMAMNQELLGSLAYTTGDIAEAQQRFTMAAALFSSVGDNLGLSRSWAHLGRNVLLLNQDEEAQQHFQEALRIAHRGKFIAYQLDAIAGIATLEAKQGRVEHAYELVEFVQTHSGTNQETKERCKQISAQLAKKLAPSQIAVTQARIQSKILDTVVNELLTRSSNL